jgi:ABC-type glycerol-3-phosphate transport system permease component
MAALNQSRLNGLARLARRALQFVAVAIAVAWCAAPIYWMLATSLKTELEANRLDPTLWPQNPTLVNFIGLSGDKFPFAAFFMNSVVSCLLTAVVCVLIATPAAYALSRTTFRTKSIISHSILSLRMLPLVVLLAPLYMLLLKARLLDTATGLVISFTTFGLPFAVWMMKSFIDAVPIEVEEAARIDGCRQWEIVLRIIVPLTLPGLLTTATFIFMDAWNNLMYPLSFITTLDKQTLPAALVLTFTGQFKTDWGGMMAAAVVTTLPLMIAFFAVQRSIVRGLTSGAVAGA